MSLRKRLPILLLLAVLGGAAIWFATRPAMPDPWLGYVEGEALYVAAPVSGTLASRPVERGLRVSAGAPLFALDPRTAEASAAQAAAQVQSAQASLSDLGAARERTPEIDVARAAEASARAQLVRAEADFRRFADLAAKGFASRTQLDAARAAKDSAAAQVAQAQAQQRAGVLSVGRGTQQAAAAAQVVGAKAALAAEARRRQEIAPVSPAAGQVEQTYFNPGEWVPANQPVVSIIPDDKRKIRFFVPQDRVAGIHPGMAVQFSCDGCGAERTATVRYIAPRAEYTPPVIYSEHARSKLVFMVEAMLPADRPLPLGLPVAVRVP
jgi:HlyD family secretion protein